jgi:hypothetical protein
LLATTSGRTRHRGDTDPFERTNAMKVIDWNPAEGQCFQGDISIIVIPAGIAISQIDEIKPVDDVLIIQEGEMTGHNHAIRHFRMPVAQVGDPAIAMRSPRLRKAFAGGKRHAEVGSARLYRDPLVAQAMQRLGILTRADLAIGCLVVESGPIVIGHDEHDGIQVPPGCYLVGRQVESAGAEERIVAD